MQTWKQKNCQNKKLGYNDLIKISCLLYLFQICLGGTPTSIDIPYGVMSADLPSIVDRKTY